MGESSVASASTPPTMMSIVPLESPIRNVCSRDRLRGRSPRVGETTSGEATSMKTPGL